MSTMVDIASKYIGTRSDNPLVAKWLAAVGRPPGESWCAAFVIGVGKEAAVSMPSIAGALRLRDALINAGHEHGMAPAPGWLYFVDHGHGMGHVGIVESFDGDVVEEISGNTLDVSSRDGGTVARNHWRLDFALNGMPVHSGKLVGFVNPLPASDHVA